ncbi:hypothetical protein ACEPAH_5220 [Sanghuangporus vaninii]
MTSQCIAEADDSSGPLFPNEIWDIIFRMATFVPHAFDTHAPDPFEYPGPPSQDELHTLLRKALRTKHSITLVCKTWNMLTTRILYEAVQVTISSSLDELLQVLEDPATADACQIPEYRRSKGRWTLRLDLNFPDVDPQQIEKFSRITRHLPNLEILCARRRFRGEWMSKWEFLELLAVQTPSKLRVLEVSGHGVSTFIGRPCLSTLPLHVLRIWPGDWYLHDNGSLLSSNLEHLHLEGPGTQQSAIQGEVPRSLTYLSLDVGCGPLGRILDDFMIIGHRLKTIEIDDHIANQYSYRYRDNYYFCEGRLESNLRRIAEYFPNLANLIINIRRPRILGYTAYLPPVERLGLRLYVTPRAGLHKMVTKLIEVTPSIKVVRILEKPTYDELTTGDAETFCAFQRTSVALMLKHAVRYEDRTGRPFHEVTLPSIFTSSRETRSELSANRRKLAPNTSKRGFEPP